MIDLGFDNNFFDEATEVARKSIGENTFVIKSEVGQIGNEQSEKLFGALGKTFSWDEKVMGGQAKEMFWGNKPIDLTLKEKMPGAMWNNFDIKASFALGKSQETVAAAAFHELVEMWREENSLIGEGAPLMAEFLLCGDDRSLFKELCSDFGKTNETHQIGWNKVVSSFGFKDGEGDLYEKMDSWKKSLSEEEKLSFIRNSLLIWEQK